ncbi:Ger(x)C family spore germination protein [Cohnella lupini]|nr:Ger(x)C family spore germination protein [Cohnella lupini]
MRVVVGTVLLSVCAGCWDYVEFEGMALVRAIGIDIDDKGKFLLTYEIIRTRKQGKESGKSKEVVQGIGKTVPEAFDNVQAIVPEELFLGYVTTIIISEGAAKQQLKKIMDYLFFTPNIRESVFLVLTKEKPESILRMPVGKSGLLVGESLVDFFKVTTHVGISYPVRVRDFNKWLMIEGIEPIAPLLQMYGEGQIKLSDMAVFNGYKQVGVLDANESKGLGRITNKKMQEMMAVSITVPDTADSAFAVFSLQDNRSKIKIKTGRAIPEVFISTKATATMTQLDGNIGAITPEILRACEKELEGKVADELEAVITKAQKETKSDFLGIGLKFYQQHRREWKVKYKSEWDEVFPEVAIHVNVNIKAIHSGTKIIPLKEQ